MYTQFSGVVHVNTCVISVCVCVCVCVCMCVCVYVCVFHSVSECTMPTEVCFQFSLLMETRLKCMFI